MREIASITIVLSCLSLCSGDDGFAFPTYGLPTEPAAGPFERAYMDEVAFPLTRELSREWHDGIVPIQLNLRVDTDHEPIDKSVIDNTPPVRFDAPPTFASMTYLR